MAAEPLHALNAPAACAILATLEPNTEVLDQEDFVPLDLAQAVQCQVSNFNMC